MPSLQSLQSDPSSHSHIFAANLSPAFAALDNHQSEPPICVTPKMKGNSGKQKNVFLDDRGFPDQSDEFNSLLHSVDGRTVLRKHKHPAPELDEIDPRFHAIYDEKLHGKQLRKNLNLSHLEPSIRAKFMA
jgi:hypothetical protein